MVRSLLLAIALVSVASLVAPALAGAQERPSASVLATTVSGGAPEDLGPSFDRVIRAELDALEVVRAQGTVVLNLGDVQLALGCEGESRACLSAVAAEIGVRFLVLPNLDRVGTTLVLGVGLFDATADSDVRRVTREASGDDAAGALVRETGPLLRELFAVPELAAGEEEPEPTEEEEPAAPPASGPDWTRVGLASAVAGLGAASLIAAIGLAAAFEGERSAYLAQATETEEDAERASALLASARSLGTAANALFVAGGVVAVAGAAWLIAELASGGGAPQALLVPFLSPDGGGFALAGVIDP